jgi:hypothetical protein
VCDDLPFQLFNGILMLPGALTPIMTASIPNVVALGVADTTQAVGFTYGGVSSLFMLQNALRSRISGANPSPGVYEPLQDAKYDVVQFKLNGVEARAQFLCNMKNELKLGLQALQAKRSHLVRMETEGSEFEQKAEFTDVHAKELEKVEASIALHEHALLDINALRRVCVKEKESLVEERTKFQSGFKIVARGWQDTMKNYCCLNPAQALAKLFFYTLPFILYSALYVGLFMASLRPSKIVVNAALKLTKEQPFGKVWVPYTIASAFYGFMIGQTFQFRNLYGATYGERALAMVGAHAQNAYKALVETCAASYRFGPTTMFDYTGVHPEAAEALSEDDVVTSDSADNAETGQPDTVIDIEPEKTSKSIKPAKQNTNPNIINLYPDSDAEPGDDD